MKIKSLLAAALVSALALSNASAQSNDAIPQSMLTPDVVETGLGKLTFNDGAPTPETAKTVSDFLIFTNGLNVYNNSFRGASAYALQKGFQSIGAKDNSVVIFPELLDSSSLFLTGNTDTVYYVSTLDLTKGPIVVEQPPKSVGTINDMWFSWIIDVGTPGPDRGEGVVIGRPIHQIRVYFCFPGLHPGKQRPIYLVLDPEVFQVVQDGLLTTFHQKRAKDQCQ